MAKNSLFEKESKVVFFGGDTARNKTSKKLNNAGVSIPLILPCYLL